MANISDSTASLPPLAPPPPLSSKTKENLTPVACKIEELNESRAELLGRIRGLKKDLQTWRSKLDSQVKVYRDDNMALNVEIAELCYVLSLGWVRNELSELKQSLNTEAEQLRSEFRELRTTLQQQHDVTTSLRNFGLEDVKGNSKADEVTLEEYKESDASTPEDDGKEAES
ncbi:hypothetical protein ACLB2K_039991 [Fragaria x ananassa]